MFEKKEILSFRLHFWGSKTRLQVCNKEEKIRCLEETRPYLRKPSPRKIIYLNPLTHTYKRFGARSRGIKALQLNSASFEARNRALSLGGTIRSCLLAARLRISAVRWHSKGRNVLDFAVSASLASQSVAKWSCISSSNVRWVFWQGFPVLCICCYCARARYLIYIFIVFFTCLIIH